MKGGLAADGAVIRVGFGSLRLLDLGQLWRYGGP